VQPRQYSTAYRGRFAPSPTGPLHFGSLVAALGSFLDARRHGGEWLVRMEDLDRQREVPGAADHILRTLDVFGFAWDGPVLRQSDRTAAYAEALNQLRRAGLLFACACSRAEIARRGRPGTEGRIYPGTCRAGLPPGNPERALRIRTDGASVGFQDRFQGQIRQDLEQEVGDFVVRRADGVHAYQLAVVVDDAHQGITQVVRGADLVLSTPRQIFLQRMLGLSPPEYAHLPLALDAAGRKLSKSEDAAPVDPRNPLPSLLRAWTFLSQESFPEQPVNLDEFWRHALPNWQHERIPAVRGMPAQVTETALGCAAQTAAVMFR
jgi:glutamyl-Q tRNA(Asp) synthetase